MTGIPVLCVVYQVVRAVARELSVADWLTATLDGSMCQSVRYCGIQWWREQ